MRIPTEEHQRRVRLMMYGAWDSQIFAVWPKEQPLTESTVEIAERVCAEHGIGGQQ
jgi:hypothetical protein